MAHLDRVLEPEGDQTAAIRTILEATAARNGRIIGNARDALRTELDSMKLRLAPLLTDRQKRRLDAMEPVPDPFRPPPPRNRPPPRDGPPPP